MSKVAYVLGKFWLYSIRLIIGRWFSQPMSFDVATARSSATTLNCPENYLLTFNLEVERLQNSAVMWKTMHRRKWIYDKLTDGNVLWTSVQSLLTRLRVAFTNYLIIGAKILYGYSHGLVCILVCNSFLIFATPVLGDKAITIFVSQPFY